MQAVILAGGLGTRLRPLTYQIPKIMIPIRGKPFLEYLLRLLERNKLKNIILCVGYLGEKIENYFSDGKKWGMNIKYSFEKEALGTGGAVKNAENLLENEFLLLNGDTFLNIDYQNLISYFYAKQKLGTMVIFKNQPKSALNNVEINSKNEVINYNKKEEKSANCIDAGVQVYKKSILELISPNKIVSLEEEIFPILIQKKELAAYPTNQKFYDIGTFKQLENFNHAL